MIKPTVGRVVWYYPPKAEDAPAPEQPLAATVSYVHSDREVNLSVSQPNGDVHGTSNVQLLQDGEDAPATGHYAEWMPYQKGQAAKTEALEADANKGGKRD